MRPFTSTLSFDEALKLALDAVVPVTATEHVSLHQADGGVVAHDVISPLDVPPFDRSAMDGYAVRSADIATAPTSLTCVGRVFTGEVWPGTLQPGECIEISTGAPMPDGADAVVMVEQTVISGDQVIGHQAIDIGDLVIGQRVIDIGDLAISHRVIGIEDREIDVDPIEDREIANQAIADDRSLDHQITVLAPVQLGQNIGRRAADLAIGSLIVARGQVLTPSRIGALAATGHLSVEVFVRPSVAIVSTGNEVVQPGLPLPAGHIYDINRFTLETVVRRHGGWPIALASPGDTIEALRLTMGAATAHNLIVFSGGSSVGDRDLVRDVIAECGDMLFHGIAVKPGKPTACAVIGDSLFLGMPGNPTSCLSNAYILLVPVLRKMAGLPAWEPRTVTVPLARRIASSSDRHQFYTVRLVDGQAEPAFKGSGDITSMANADGYIEIPAGTSAIDQGTAVTITLF